MKFVAKATANSPFVSLSGKEKKKKPLGIEKPMRILVKLA